mmetsp:Transcript_33109/g.98407  ORF Transcript_33109/g.98407 Transcript_33109/m.98407 type:complete len:200 (-) Transcript_33109:59-658(-)
MASWFPHVGSEIQTSWHAGGRCCLTNSETIRSAPVPESAWTEATRPLCTASLPEPKRRPCVSVFSRCGPSMVLYSLSTAVPSSLSTSSSASRTASSTRGLPCSVRYAPTPRLIFRASVSALNIWVVPRIGSMGAPAMCSKRPASPYRSTATGHSASAPPTGTDLLLETLRAWSSTQTSPAPRRQGVDRHLPMVGVGGSV